jgi:hypothetical protein
MAARRDYVGGPFGTVETEGTKVVSSIYKGLSSGGRPFYTLILQTRPDAFQSIDCEHQP